MELAAACMRADLADADLAAAWQGTWLTWTWLPLARHLADAPAISLLLYGSRRLYSKKVSQIENPH